MNRPGPHWIHPDEIHAIGGENGPLYLRLRGRIRRAVEDGRLKAEDALPPEREMAVQLGVSRVTIRRALEGLVAEGLLQQRHGSGTFVTPRTERVQQPLSRLTSFSRDMQIRGRRPTTEWLERSVAPPTPNEMLVLGISPKEQVTRIHRLRLADGLPMAVERATLPARVLPDPESIGASLYETLQQRGFRPVRALQRLRAENLSADDAALLGVPAGSAALSIERVAYLQDGAIVEFTRSSYRGDAYDFVAELTLSEELNAE
ncbi:GntR family transcriptional regulator [Faunimonas pinastri]|uniref:GntR family transcriptional regulator n=1 Tax=Faunimonas pinastri TaxID=1855383 RepID=A0A1H9ADK4_9HYPH|nr:GntR family transcriptional regulator [Faunimonas pinastri]SEP74048.1 GntR family transcriptional regulator [Faunimonas pinastri]